MGPNRLDVFVHRSDNSDGLFVKSWTGSTWVPSATTFTSLGRRIVGSPTAVSWGPDRVDLFMFDETFGMRHKARQGSQWFPSVTTSDNLSGTFGF